MEANIPDTEIVVGLKDLETFHQDELFEENPNFEGYKSEENEDEFNPSQRAEIDNKS